MNMIKQLNRPALYLFLFAFFMVLMLPRAAFADGMPEPLQGKWYLVSCDAPQMMVVNTEYFNIQSEKKGYTLFMLTRDIEKREDYYRLLIGSMPAAFHITPQGQLLHNIAPDDSASGEAANWADLNHDFNLPYVRCEDEALTAAIDPVLAGMLPELQKLDDLHRNCPFTGREENLACHKKLFESADDDKSGTLDRNEIIRLYETADYIFANMSGIEEENRSGRARDFARDVAGLTGRDNPQELSLTYETVRAIWPDLYNMQSGQDFTEKIFMLHQLIAADMDRVSDCSTQSALENAAIPQSSLTAEYNSCIMKDESYLTPGGSAE